MSDISPIKDPNNPSMDRSLNAKLANRCTYASN